MPLKNTFANNGRDVRLKSAIYLYDTRLMASIWTGLSARPATAGEWIATLTHLPCRTRSVKTSQIAAWVCASRLPVDSYVRMISGS